MTTITKPEIATEILEDIKTSIDNEKQVIVHCCFSATAFGDFLIRIWPSTFLIDATTGHRSALIHHENISLFPYWSVVPPMKDYWFTLIFAGLPKDCTSFDLKEIIPQEGGFEIEGIKRNKTDVYKVKLS
ncbi:hypothetical protein CO230_04265 [Chryseobacterium sp. 6424]|uniref:hypothetical protein n=1 Tax=Chryseobacterium sp. 6424 TaxID=2039166 RepID=UPI000EFA4F9E|nr:hypothetical protein [Chryseobacterium sp. 6424]AYO57406.1 hypothetical protein CO230_04265 [Chryseobacterium sp. 6424]